MPMVTLPLRVRLKTRMSSSSTFVTPKASQWTAFATHEGRLVGCNMAGEVLMHVRDVLRARA